MQNPNPSCDCPLGTFQRKLCGHVSQMWDELDSFGKQHVIHHDEVIGKSWYRGPKPEARVCPDRVHTVLRQTSPRVPRIERKSMGLNG
jgi:hypothetical protein